MQALLLVGSKIVVSLLYRVCSLFKPLCFTVEQFLIDLVDVSIRDSKEKLWLSPSHSLQLNSVPQPSIPLK